MTSVLVNKFFGPLGKDYCGYFYVLSALGLMVMIITVLSFAAKLFINRKVSYGFMVKAATTLLSGGIMYLSNRLLANMCNAP